MGENLTTEIISVKYVTDKQLNEMFELFSCYYSNVGKEKFIADFYKKNWVIHLRANKETVGFSTQQVFAMDIEGEKRNFLYSGDTIVIPSYWQKSTLSGGFCHLMNYIINSYYPQEVYWFLTSKGFRTFRYLPVFFKRFHPSEDFSRKSDWKKILDAVAFYKFQNRYDRNKGVISPLANDNVLNAELCELPSGRLKSGYIKFFMEINPDFRSGVELACITRLSKDNFKQTIFKVLENTKVLWNISE